MKRPGTAHPEPLFSISQNTAEALAIELCGGITIHNASPMLHALQKLVTEQSPQSLSVGLGQVSSFDEYGALVLFEIRSLMSRRQGALKLLHPSENVKKILTIVNFDAQETQPTLTAKPARRYNLFVRIGRAVMDAQNDLTYLITFVGAVSIALIKVLYHPKSLRLNDTITNMDKTGVNALPIVALISFLLGLIMAFMSSLQLKQFGANIYVASLVSLAMVSELGPIMTAIIVAGRSGSAFAAEIGTMKINEEIDALFTMGFDPIMFLAVPKIIAAVIVVPILTLFSNLFAIAGALLVGISMLGLTPSSFIHQTLETLTLFEVVWGLAKSAIFALIISWTGSLRGFQARGGASSVGNAATSAVVSSIFLIILFDSLFAVMRSYW